MGTLRILYICTSVVDIVVFVLSHSCLFCSGKLFLVCKWMLLQTSVLWSFVHKLHTKNYYFFFSCFFSFIDVNFSFAKHKRLSFFLFNIYDCLVSFIFSYFLFRFLFHKGKKKGINISKNEKLVPGGKIIFMCVFIVK